MEPGPSSQAGQKKGKKSMKAAAKDITIATLEYIDAQNDEVLKEGTLKERVEVGLDLLRNNKISGEKVVVDILA